MAKNILGDELMICSTEPVTGYFRNGKCDTCAEDRGMHTLCARMTQEFLEFSRDKGNDLMTPVPEFGFAGLQAGDCWCICLGRWLEALEAGVAPPVKLESTHASVVEFVDLDILRHYACERD